MGDGDGNSFGANSTVSTANDSPGSGNDDVDNGSSSGGVSFDPSADELANDGSGSNGDNGDSWL